MKTIGFPIGNKENEYRRALTPDSLSSVCHPEYIYIQKGYGEVLGFSDEEYRRYGAHVVSFDEVLLQNIICDPKVGDAEYLTILDEQVVFGWIHAVQNRDITDKLIEHRLTAYAWEDMYERGRHIFWRNNEIAGEAAVQHAYLCHGIFPYHTKAAVLGRGNSARGAIRTLNYMGADVVVYDRRTEALLQEELGQYDVIVNAVLWDTSRRDHIIYKDDLKRMKRNAMIIDISCDRAGGIETSIPTTIDNPTYLVDGIRHYVVDHTPSLFYKTASESISRAVAPYFDCLIEEIENPILQNSHITDRGKILDKRIVLFQNR